MRYGIYTATALALVAGGPVFALGLDRGEQDIGIIFEEGRLVELNFASVNPALRGTDAIGGQTGDVGPDFTMAGIGLKLDLTPQWSAALILDQPFGIDVNFGPGALYYAGTKAELDSTAITAIARYRLDDTLSVHAGLRQQTLDADVTLAGLAYGGLDGYNLSFEDARGTGWVLGAAYERTDIALRVAVTYNSEIEHDFDAVETMPDGTVLTGKTQVLSPEAWNIALQTGIAADTLVFANIRHATYTDTLLSPPQFNGATGGMSITEIEDGTSWLVGVGRQFTPEFAGQIAIGYEAPLERALISPLAPYSGMQTVSVGGSYTIDNIVISGGLRYGLLGDADTFAGTERGATFTDNTMTGIAMNVAYRF